MADLTTTYMGLALKNPIIAAASGLTDTAEGVAKCEEVGAGAVVMKSVFEEQIIAEVDEMMNESIEGHPEWRDYLDIYSREHSIQLYLDQIRKACKNASIPVIGSVNCVSTGGWTDFVRRMEDTGIAGLELNIFIMPHDLNQSSDAVEQIYLDIFNQVKTKVNLPLALKLPPYITTPGRFVRQLADEGVTTFVLFNRPLPFDLDIESQKVKVGNIISSPTEMTYSLRMVSQIAGLYDDVSLSASTGAHDAASVIKHIMAGANAVQVCSALYKNDIGYIRTLLNDVEKWLDDHDMASIDEIRGKLSQKNSKIPAAYERAQYIKAFSNIS